MSRRERPGRVLVLPQEIAGLSSGLVRGFRELGVDADLLVRTRHPFGYVHPPASTRGLGRLQWLLGRLAPEEGRDGSSLRMLCSLVVRLCAMPWLWLSYDAFLYVGPTTLTGLAVERRLARALGKVVVTVFTGSDARPPYLSGFFVSPADGAPDLAELRRRTKAVSRRVRQAEACSTYVVNHPPSAQFHRKPFIDVTTMGIPVTAPAPRQRGRIDPAAPVRVVHAPSMHRWKGTEEIRAAIAQLSDEGLAIDYIELVDVPHDAVMETLAGADLVVDELYSDAILAGLATEAASLGVPPLVFGYARSQLEPIAASIGVGLEHYASPEQLVDVLRRFITRPELRTAIGDGLRDYVTRDRSLPAVADRYRRLLLGAPEPSWIQDPGDVSYVAGWGIERSAHQRFLAELVASQGVTALELPPESLVRQAIMRDAAAEGSAGEA